MPRDLRQTVRCGCGAQLRLAWVPVHAGKPVTVGPKRELQPTAVPARAAPRPNGIDLDGVTFAQPVKVYRGSGAEREWQWGATTDTPVSPGDRLLIVAKNGNGWNAVVEAIVGSARNGSGHQVTLVGRTWKPARTTA